MLRPPYQLSCVGSVIYCVIVVALPSAKSGQARKSNQSKPTLIVVVFAGLLGAHVRIRSCGRAGVISCAGLGEHWAT